MHGTKHTGDEFVYAITLVDQRDQCRYPTFIIGPASEVREDELLQLLNFILKLHKIRDSLITFIGIVD